MIFGLLVGMSLPAFAQAASADALQVIPNTGLSSTVASLAFSPDDRWIVSGSEDNTIKLWDRSSGRLLRTLNGQNRKILSVQVSPDGKLVFSQSEDGVVNIWDSITGKLVRSFGDVRAGSVDSVVGKATLSSDGRFVFVGSLQAIRRIDMATGSVNRSFPRPGPHESWQDFAVAPDGAVIGAITSAMPAPAKNAFRIGLVDPASGKLVKVLGTYPKDTYFENMAFSADGRLLAVAAAVKLGPSTYKGTTQVWETASGRSLYTVVYTTSNSPFVSITQAQFSPDGRKLATAGKDGIKFWNARTGRELFRPDDRENSQANVLAYSHDGRTIASAKTLTITVRDAETGRLLPVSFGQPELSAVSLASLDDGRWLGVGPQGMTIWDPSTWQLSQSLGAKPDAVVGWRQYQAKGASGRTLILAQDDNALALNLWDTSTGRIARTFEWGRFRKTDKPCPTCGTYGLTATALSPNGRWITASLYGDAGVIKVWDASSGRLAYTLPVKGAAKAGPAGQEAQELMFSPDSRLLLALNEDASFTYHISRWALDTGKQVGNFSLPSKFGVGSATLYWPALSPDGRWLAGSYSIWIKGTTNTIDTIALFDVAAGRFVRAFNAPGVSNAPSVVRFSHDGRYVFVGTRQGGVNQWEASSGQLVRSFEGSAGQPMSIAFSGDGSQLVTGNSNGTSSVWNIRTGELLVTTLHAKSGEWVSITPEGFFSASARGAELLHVVKGFETIGIDQVYQSLYRPDLVREKLAGDPRGLVRDAAAQLDLAKVVASGNAPDVRLALPGRALGPVSIDGNSISAEAEITDRGGGIGRVEWRVNGTTVGVEDPQNAGGGQPVRLTRSVLLDPGDNDIEVVAYNRANLIASVPARINIAAQTASPSLAPPQPATPSQAPSPSVAASRPRLFALVAGVDDYADKRIKLSYAVSDATAVARGFKAAADGFYQSAEVKLLTDADVTRDKLDAAFHEIASKMQPSDVFVLYLAGHGKTVDGRYYFIPRDFTIDGEFSEKSINAAVKAKGVTQDQLQRWFASIPARKSVILFDTCDSGTLAGDAGETQKLEKGAANDRLAQAIGRSIITASGGSQEAIEGYHNHGLFTYELLDALDRADSDHSGTIEVTELAAYVYAEVSELSLKVFKQRQAPQMKITANYPLMKQTRVLQDEAVPIAEARPAYQVAQTAELQIKPGPGATVVRSLNARTAVTVLESENGWSLIAADGEPLGYVAARDLAPAQ